MAQAREKLVELLQGRQWLALTGSGSSQFAGECVHPALQAELGIPACTIGGGSLLIDGAKVLPPSRPGGIVSLARSGDSPESAGVVEWLLETEPQVSHLVITCNAQGRLSTSFAKDARVTVLGLDPSTNDVGLVMTSSFTNMVIAAGALGLCHQQGAHEQLVHRLASIARRFISKHVVTLARAARQPYRKAVYLGGNCRLGAAKECALKMVEINGGRIPVMAETFLGVRHGPMCFIDRDTLLVCFLASEPTARAYEQDVIEEINRKGLGPRKLIIGEQVPSSLLLEDDLALETEGLAALGDANAPVLDVLAGQFLAFFRCLAEGLKPDTPSSGVINRVVNEFKLYGRSSRQDSRGTAECR